MLNYYASDPFQIVLVCPDPLWEPEVNNLLRQKFLPVPYTLYDQSQISFQPQYYILFRLVNTEALSRAQQLCWIDRQVRYMRMGKFSLPFAVAPGRAVRLSFGISCLRYHKVLSRFRVLKEAVTGF